MDGSQIRRKPRLLIIGHGRHGKDTVAEMIADVMWLNFTSSSMFVAEEVIWDFWGKDRYPSFQAMYDDRSNCRKTWANLISAYNTPDKTKTAATMLSRGFDMYVGMRREDEWKACMDKMIFDHVIWVDACDRLPKEGKDSMDLEISHADLCIDNNGPITALMPSVLALQKKLHEEGFDVQYEKETLTTHTLVSGLNGEPGLNAEPGLDGEILTWMDKPEGALTLLDHGFIRVLDVMGSDKSIADSARMSYGRGTKKVNTDEGLINYLVKNHHTSPLEMGEIQFHMRLPIFVMRQLIRHRTANVNEYSGRYSEMVRLFYVPAPEQICSQDKVNKQGSAETLGAELAEAVQQTITEISNQAFDEYEMLLGLGVSRETARMVLPLNTYTECVWKIDVNNLIKLLKLRDDSHAQYEIRVYAKVMAEALERFFPLVYAAYMRSRESVTLTQDQIKALINDSVAGLAKGEAKQIQDLVKLYAK